MIVNKIGTKKKIEHLTLECINIAKRTDGYVVMIQNMYSFLYAL